MHWRASGKADIRSLTYDVKDVSHYCSSENTQPKTWSFWLIVKWEDSTRALRLINGRIIIPNFDIGNWVEYGGTLTEGATGPWPLSTFIIWIRLEFTNLIENLVKNFGNCIKNLQTHKTPCMHKFLIFRPIIESKKISAEDQRKYLSGVLFLVKHLRPDIANITRELSKANDGANSAAFKCCYMWLSMCWIWKLLVWIWNKQKKPKKPTMLETQ